MVAVVLRGRPFQAVMADMIEGVIVAQRAEGSGGHSHPHGPVGVDGGGPRGGGVGLRRSVAPEHTRPGGVTGSRRGLKPPWSSRDRVGSNPAPGTL